MHDTVPDVPAVPDVDFAVRARLTVSSLTVTVRPVVLSLADFLEPLSLPPHAAISTATRESATTEAARRERMRFTVPQHGEANIIPTLRSPKSCYAPSIE